MSRAVFSLSLIIQVLFFASSVHAQKSPGNTLLWRISGNGLQQSSYLFGTMHLNDKRLFNFDDSVYLAIEKCEGMAIEVNPDEMMAYFINDLFENLTRERLENVLSERDYNRYSKDLSKKFKKPAADINTLDIVREKNRWMNDYLEKGEMPTFVDAFLYNLARKQGKWVGGIEDISDQVNLVDQYIDKTDIEYILADDAAPNTSYKKTMDKMIRLYQAQDLDGIDLFMNGHADSTWKDQILIKRNKKMARRMDSLSAIRTMFFAVGAAHLKGESGVIELLQQRGFTVEPVFSKNKIDQKNYKPKEVDIPWIAVKDKKELYEVSMPLQPTPVKLYGVVEMNFLLDIFNYSGYYTLAVPGRFTAANRDSMLHAMAKQLTRSEKKVPGKPVNKNGVTGFEYATTIDGYKMRLQLYTEENIVYAVAMIALKPELLQSTVATKYFDSFIMKKQSSIAKKDNYLFIDSVMGVQVASPVELVENKQLGDLNNESWKITGFSGTDMNTGTIVMLFSREVKPGYSIVSDSTIYEEHNTILKKTHKDIRKKELITQYGKIVEYTGIQTENPSFLTKIHSSIRNNKSVVLIVVSDTSNYHLPVVQNIFNSLQFMDPPARKWNWYSDEKKRLTAWLPGAIQPVPESFNNRAQTLGYDSTTSTSYFIRIDTIGKYRWFTNDSTLYVDASSDVSENIETVYKKDIRRGNLKGKQFLFRFPDNYDLYRRSMILLSDSVLYKLAVTGGRKMVTNANTDKFFDSLIIHHQGNEEFATISKSKILIADLDNGDSSVRYAANEALDDAPFVETDVPLLHEALFKHYQSTYDSSYSITINSSVGDALAKLTSSSTVRFIKNKYPDLLNDSTGMQSVAINTLAKIKTRESFATLAELLNKYPLHDQLDYTFTRSLQDSLTLTKTIFNDLLPLAADTNAAPALASIVLTLIDSGIVDQKQIKSSEQAFINSSKQLVPSFMQENYFRYGSYQLLSLLEKFGTADAYDVMRQYLDVKNTYLAFDALQGLVTKGQSVPQKSYDFFAADTAFRASLYDTLQKLNKLEVFPKKYLTQAWLAQSVLYGRISDDDYENMTIELIGTKEASYEKNKYQFYLFKVTFNYDEPEAYLGVSDGYNRNKNILTPELKIGGLHYTEPLEKNNSSKLFNTFLKEKQQEKIQDIEEITEP